MAKKVEENLAELIHSFDEYNRNRELYRLGKLSAETLRENQDRIDVCVDAIAISTAKLALTLKIEFDYRKSAKLL